MSGQNMRGCFRVRPDEGDVLELAVWFRHRPPQGALHVTQLGKPSLLMGRSRCTPFLEDISAEGLNLSIRTACPYELEPLRESHVLVYLKLADLHDPLDAPMSFMLGCEIVRFDPLDTQIRLGLRITHEGEPEVVSKSLRFVNVEKHGINDLTRWCDTKDRLSRLGKAKPYAGLRLDRLLAEIHAALDRPAEDPPSCSG